MSKYLEIAEKIYLLLYGKYNDKKFRREILEEISNWLNKADINQSIADLAKEFSDFDIIRQVDN